MSNRNLLLTLFTVATTLMLIQKQWELATFWVVGAVVGLSISMIVRSHTK